MKEFILKLEVSFSQSIEDKFSNGQRKKGVGLFLRDKVTFYLKSGELKNTTTDRSALDFQH